MVHAVAAAHASRSPTVSSYQLPRAAGAAYGPPGPVRVTAIM